LKIIQMICVTMNAIHAGVGVIVMTNHVVVVRRKHTPPKT